MLCYYPIENKELLKNYRDKIKKFPFFVALMKLSNSNAIEPVNELEKVIKTMNYVALPVDFSDDIFLVAGNTDEIYKNHEILKKLT